MSEPRQGLTTYQRNQILILLIVAMLMGAGFYWRWKQLQNPEVVRDELREAGRLLKVKLEGKVTRPGVYELLPDATVRDLLRQAGEKEWESRLTPTWLDMLLYNGAAVQVWETRDGAPQLAIKGMDTPSMGVLFMRFDLNEASVDDLKSLDGIGEETARAIVEFREKNGPFKRVEDLADVPGVGPKIVEKLRYQVLVGQSSDRLPPDRKH
jgi:competence protein ComEA